MRRSKPETPTTATGTEKPAKRSAGAPFVERRGAIVTALFKTFDDPRQQEIALSELPPRPLTVSDEEAVGAILNNAKLNVDAKINMLRVLFRNDWAAENRRNKRGR